MTAMILIWVKTIQFNSNFWMHKYDIYCQGPIRFFFFFLTQQRQIQLIKRHYNFQINAALLKSYQPCKNPFVLHIFSTTRMSLGVGLSVLLTNDGKWRVQGNLFESLLIFAFVFSYASGTDITCLTFQRRIQRQSQTNQHLIG